MLNQLVIVGRLNKDVELIEDEQGRKKAIIELACPRSYKNADGEYDTDYIDIILWLGIAENTNAHCKKGDVVGVKGRIQSETKDGEKVMSIVAEKITFLSSRKPDEEV